MVARLAVTLPSSLVFLAFFASFTAAGAVAADSTSEESEVPRGVYHFSDTDRDVETSFRIPDFGTLDPIKVASDLMSSAMKVDTRRKTLAGIEMPFSLTGRPMSLQINGESHDAVSLVDDPKKGEKTAEVRRSDMTPESRKAFLRARQVCLEQSADSCDEALDTFHRVRYGKSLLMAATESAEGEENGSERLRTIIERRLKQVPSTSSSPTSSESDPYVTSTSESLEDVEEDGEEDEEKEENTPKTHRFSHITLPKYHDKASSFLRDIN